MGGGARCHVEKNVGSGIKLPSGWPLGRDFSAAVCLLLFSLQASSEDLPAMGEAPRQSHRLGEQSGGAEMPVLRLSAQAP